MTKPVDFKSVFVEFFVAASALDGICNEIGVLHVVLSALLCYPMTYSVSNGTRSPLKSSNFPTASVQQKHNKEGRPKRKRSVSRVSGAVSVSTPHMLLKKREASPYRLLVTRRGKSQGNGNQKWGAGLPLFAPNLPRL